METHKAMLVRMARRAALRRTAMLRAHGYFSPQHIKAAEAENAARHKLRRA